MAPKHPVLIMRDRPHHRLAHESHVERVLTHRELQRIDEVMTGNGAQPREKHFRKIQVALAKGLPFGLVRVAVGNAKGAFQNKPESRARRFRYVQEYDHGIGNGFSQRNRGSNSIRTLAELLPFSNRRGSSEFSLSRLEARQRTASRLIDLLRG